ncbi:MAG: ATP-binding protein [Bauldia sp.]
MTDTGTGIAPELMAKVFEPFFTTKGAGEGSGLGLAMVHGFVKQSGGHVRIYSEVGHGTSVKIYLPRLVEAEQGLSAPVERKTAGAPSALGARAEETILVVEDNEGVREYARSALEDIGYHVLQAGDAAGALSIIEGRERIDLLFTDVVLPGGMNGASLPARPASGAPGCPSCSPPATRGTPSSTTAGWTPT